MRVSIVIPAFNEEKRIGACVDSILRSIRVAGCDAEVIVVDNACTDRTVEVASSRPGVRVVREPRKGLLHARQKGFESARGDLMACIDADCLMKPQWLDRVVRSFDRSPRLVCLSGPYVYHDVSSFSNWIVMLWYICSFVVLDLVGKRVFNRAALIQAGNYMVRRSAMRQVGGYNRSITFFGEDIELACRLQRVGAVRFSFRLRMRSSGRRFRKEGYIATGIAYMTNALFVVFHGRPSTQRYTDVREP